MGTGRPGRLTLRGRHGTRRTAAVVRERGEGAGSAGPRAGAAGSATLARRLRDRGPAAVQDGEELGELLLGLVGAGERREGEHRLEALLGDRLGIGELAQPVGAVDAAEAGVAD